MCGVGGVAGAQAGRVTAERLTEWGTRISHRGPDGAGTWIDPQHRAAFFHRRLSVIDLSPAGDQPMASADGSWTVTYNGELYNTGTLRAAMPGIAWRGTSDTEVLVEALAEWGLSATLDRLEGMFAFAAWHAPAATMWLVRDRLGEKPMMWWHHDGTLAFASELGALPPHAQGKRIDPSAAADVLRWGFVVGEHTIYEGVQQLPPGGLLRAEVREGRVERVDVSRWFDLDRFIEQARAAGAAKSRAEAVHQLRTLLRDSVAARLDADVPLGAFLSGGVDSALVAAFAQQAMGERRLQTFTVRIPEAGLDESADARATAATIGSEHTEVELPIADMLAVVPTLAGAYDQPFGDPSMLPTLLLCRAARQQLTVCLAGDGGDEVFAGYNRHALGASLERNTKWVPSSLRRAMARGVLATRPTTLDKLGGVTRVLPPELRVPNVGDKAHKAANVLAANGGAWDALAGLWPASALGAAATLPRHGSEGMSEVERMLMQDTAVVLPDQMLTKVDRASMAASLEVRLPFLDHRLLAWAWAQPLEWKTHRGVGKVLLRELLGTEVPAAARRPKLGFDPPVDTWLRGPLRPWAEELLRDPVCMREGWLHADALRSAWAEHQDGRRNHGYRLWPVLMLEGWMAMSRRSVSG